MEDSVVKQSCLIPMCDDVASSPHLQSNAQRHGNNNQHNGYACSKMGDSAWFSLRNEKSSSHLESRNKVATCSGQHSDSQQQQTCNRTCVDFVLACTASAYLQTPYHNVQDRYVSPPGQKAKSAMGAARLRKAKRTEE